MGKGVNKQAKKENENRSQKEILDQIKKEGNKSRIWTLIWRVVERGIDEIKKQDGDFPDLDF